MKTNDPLVAVTKGAGCGQMRWHAVWLGLLFFLGIAWRVSDLRSPGLLADREYLSAIFSRVFYFELSPTIEDWRRDIALATKHHQPVLEPPVTEYLVALIYRVAGHEDLRYARLLTSMFWLVGGLFMYQLAREVLSPAEALYATGYYLLLPMSVLISRSYQPDALMMLLYLISLVCIWRYFQLASVPRVLLAGGFTGITLLVRPLVAFALAAAVVGLVVWKIRTGQRVNFRHLVLYGVLSLALPAIYYGNAIALAGFMRWKVDHSFRPFMFARRQFWSGWLALAVGVIGQGALSAAILGFPLMRQGAGRAVIVGMSAGYVAFGLAFTYHIHTHAYYHIQLIPIVAVCLAPALRLLIDALGRLQSKWWLVPGLTALMLTLYLNHRAIRTALHSATVDDPVVAREVGALIAHSSRTVFVARHYGFPLQYLGELTGAAWPVRIDDPFYRWPSDRERTVEERIAALGFIPEYYVITALDQARQRHQDLLDYLATSCHPLAQTDGYWIYHDCRAGEAEHSVTFHPTLRSRPRR